jgi:hypothetical protein
VFFKTDGFSLDQLSNNEYGSCPLLVTLHKKHRFQSFILCILHFCINGLPSHTSWQFFVAVLKIVCNFKKKKKSTPFTYFALCWDANFTEPLLQVSHSSTGTSNHCQNMVKQFIIHCTAQSSPHSPTKSHPNLHSFQVMQYKIKHVTGKNSSDDSNMHTFLSK